MDLILSRHGNTFGPNDKVVWAGSANDIPLVAKGIEQAVHLAKWCLCHKINPKAVYCSSLRRTKAYAQIYVKEMECALSPVIDKRLDEIDYGAWTGLSNDEIQKQYGDKELQLWKTKSVWPKSGIWGSKENTIIQETLSFASDISQKFEKTDTVLIVTSNGRLRYFLKLINDEFEKHVEQGIFKVKTGNICKISFDGNFDLRYWNVNPNECSENKL